MHRMNTKGVLFEFHTDQLSESIYFYRDVLGFKYLGIAESPASNISALFAANETCIFEVHDTPDATVLYQGFVARVGIEVDDVDALYQRVLAKGWRDIKPIWTWHHGRRIFSAIDPNGIWIDFYTVVSDRTLQNE